MKHVVTAVALVTFLAGLPVSAAEAAPAPAPVQGPVNRSCKVIKTVEAVFPMSVMHRGIKYGNATLLLEIDETGALKDVLVTAYTQEAFAQEAESVARLWKYEPGIVNDRPITTILSMDFRFEVNGVITVANKDAFSTPMDAILDSGYAFQARGLKQVDRIPTPIKIVQPTYPLEWANTGVVGQVVVDFYIDRQGKVRMLSCAAGTDPRLGGIALSAVEKWEFSPPTWKGVPVLVHARQVFHFGQK